MRIPENISLRNYCFQPLPSVIFFSLMAYHVWLYRNFATVASLLVEVWGGRKRRSERWWRSARASREAEDKIPERWGSADDFLFNVLLSSLPILPQNLAFLTAGEASWWLVRLWDLQPHLEQLYLHKCLRAMSWSDGLVVCTVHCFVGVWTVGVTLRLCFLRQTRACKHYKASLEKLAFFTEPLHSPLPDYSVWGGCLSC